MAGSTPNPANFHCPVPLTGHAEIQMAHGGGGRLTQELIERVFGPAFANPSLDARHDGAVLEVPPGTRLAFTTDSHVVSPLFFPGGDIGRLAVHGTVNDLAMCGARPRWLSAGFVLEEGLALDVLRRVVESMGAAARAAGVSIVTGDTKVVERGKGDGLYVNTSGIGVIEIAETAGLAATLEENSVAVCEAVRGACELLGLDPFYVANEGRFIAFVPETQAAEALAIMKRFAADGGAARIGEVRESPMGEVTLRSTVGVERILDRLSGEQLPRIC